MQRPLRVRQILALAAIAALLPWPSGIMLAATDAQASSVSSAVFSGGAGTVGVGGTVYAKQGAALTLTVVTSSDTKCVDVTGAVTLPRQTSSTAKSNWTFTTTAPAGDGAQAFTVAASPNFNTNGACTGQTNSTQASYTLDNTGPVVAAAVTPAANTAGWNNSDVTVRWTATDAGSGVTAAQPFKTDSVTANGVVTLTALAQSDRLGNTGAAGSVTVRVDKAAPTITAAQTKNADGTTTVTFTCGDSNSGGGEASGIATCLADGSTTNSKTVQPGATVTGTATDRAGNTSTATSTAPASDSTPPTITNTFSPLANAAGWTNADTTVKFACADNTGGSGILSCVADGTTSDSKTITAETNGTQVAGTATDKAGNKATSTATVKLDKTAPVVTASKDRNANTAGWYDADVTVRFVGTDALSGVATTSPAKVLGEGADQSATGTATDTAGNTGTAGVTGVNVDKTAPTLSGAPTTSANGDGWYSGDVAIKWTASDSLSGLAGAAPANATIDGEGTGLTATASVSDKAGNAASATSPAVKIDRTAPATGISGTSNSWTNGAVTVSLTATDKLSGVASTSYSVDGGARQTGDGFTLTAEGDHTVTFFSTDKAGNAEPAQTAHVKIDKTAPTIRHAFNPSAYTDGAWTKSDVTVTFTCADQGGSGVASCTDPVTKTTEGKSQQVVGTAKDTAGNSASDTAIVSIDKTAPTISGSKDRAANADGWYDDDVTVSFDAADALSGVDIKTADKVFGEGRDQSVTGTATDSAGNSASDTLGGINVDKTAPVLNGTFSDGWHTRDVIVAWSCTDALSGVAKGAADDTVTGEGANLSSSSSCTDKAGNASTKTVGGIKIDRTAPATGSSVAGKITNGWYDGDVSVELKASDNLSGVANTHYSVDGGAAQVYSGAVAIAGDGTHTVTYWSTDNAGNVESKTGNTITLKIDKAPPTLSGEATTAPNGDGWYTGDVTVDWTCADATSGIDGTCPADSVIKGEGGNLSASASVSDVAGNATNKTVDGIKIDRTAPTTTANVPATPASGWHTGAVEVKLAGHDGLSGVKAVHYTVDGGETKTYSGAFEVTADGQHKVEFWSTDKAGNVEKAGAPVTFQIDKTAPTTDVTNPISPESGWFVTSGIPFAFKANDAGSGVKATYYTINGGEPQTYGKPFTADLSTGKHTVKYWSVDVAGNAQAQQELTLSVDTIAPTIKGTQSPTPNDAGWNNTDVNVKFTCTDADSGINGVAGCAGDTTLSNDGAAQMVKGDAVDVAGNRSSTEFGPVKIDKTKPTLVGVPADPNGAGWHKGDVKVQWVGDDALSGIDAASQPADSTVTGEGSSLGAGPATIKDKAGNTSDPASVTGIKIDRTAPVVNGGATTQPNAAGWYKNAVTVDFTCTDALSGVAFCPTSKTITSDGVDLSATSAPATDKAGNASAGKTVGGFKIDSQAPQTSAAESCDGKNGYCKGQTATVVLTAKDQAGLSGVKEIRYSVNDSTQEKVATGSSVSVIVPLAAKSGTANVKYYAVDHAGNTETPSGVALKFDNIAPTVTHTVNPKPNADGWNTVNTTVHFDATDDDGGSGVDTVTADQLVSVETAGELVKGSAFDFAGNEGTDSVTVKLDKTKPTISGAVTSGTKTASGWYSGPVTVTFTCGDALSGVATCPDPVVLAKNGANTATGTVTDKAGNTESATVSGINIDQEKPTLTTADVNVQGQTYTLGGTIPAATCTATDTFSGVDTCKVAVSGGNASGVGTFTYTATATDKAGNSTTITGSYTVKYRFDGFLQPINDTAHQVGVSTSVFKAGSTIPAKFQLKKADGTLVQAASAPVWFTPVIGSAMNAPVDEAVYSLPADSGSSYKYDASAQQYAFNWKSGSKAGNYWRIGVKLDDGQTYNVNIGLR